MRTRWEKKVKSKYKVLNRKKRIEYTWPYGVSSMWADTGAVCSCFMCQGYGEFGELRYSKQRRNEDKEVIREYWLLDAA